jgi:hypothetical protein
MKTKSAVFGILICVLLAQVAFGQNAPKAMTNSDVVAMAKAGLPEDTIISALGAQETSFDNSAAALVDLVKQGVSAKIIDAMIAASKKPRGAAEAAPATPSPAPNANTPVVSGAQQFAPAPAPPAPSNQAGPANPAGQAQGARGNANQNANANQNTNAPQAGGGGFFGRLNQTMQQTQGAIQQGGDTARQAQGTVQGLQGTAQSATGNPNQPAAGKAPAAGNPAVQPQPRAVTPAQAAPNQPRAATPTPAPAGAPPAQDVQAIQAQRAAAAQQRQQQAQALQQKMQDCRTQATKIDPQMATPEAQKAYASCVQAVIQANTQANAPANRQAR